MKNWVISENKKIVCKVGEFLIQVTTIEDMVGRIYNEFVVEESKMNKFSEFTLGKKIYELAKEVKIGDKQDGIKSTEDYKSKRNQTNLRTRLCLLNKFRNKIAHDVLEYNPINRQIYIKSENLLTMIDDQIFHADDLLSDLNIVLLSIRDPKMKGYKDGITL